MKRNILTLVLSFIIFSLQAQQVKPVSVIFDTDIGNDVDDCLALAMLYNYQKQGAVDLKAVTVSKANPAAVAYVDMLNRYYNLPNISIGYVGSKGPTPEAGNFLRQTLGYKKHGEHLFRSDSTLAERVPEAYKLQRKILASSADQSVVMIVVGFSTNVARLLNSGADEFSSLVGKDLIKKKVSKLYLMAGSFAEKPYAEYNITEDIKSAQTVFNQWPTELYTSGFEIGSALKFPAKTLLDNFKAYWEHPIVNSYFSYIKMPYDRETWDLTAVLEGVFPGEGNFKYSAPGKITIDDKGFSTHTPVKNGKQFYFILDSNKQNEIVERMVKDVVAKE